jgi:hypothetical protein
VPYLQELGRAHRKFGVRERHYEVFRRALLATLQRFAAPRWNETAKHAWEMAYNRAATIMIEAAKDDAAESLAWWMATVAGIELRGPDIGVLTRHQDLYDLAALQEMELLYRWLQVIPAVSDEPAHDHGTMYGTVPELAAKATWADREIYISGPDHMIVKTARVLRERGAPDRLIHYDLDPKASQGL